MCYRKWLYHVLIFAAKYINVIAFCILVLYPVNYSIDINSSNFLYILNTYSYHLQIMTVQSFLSNLYLFNLLSWFTSLARPFSIMLRKIRNGDYCFQALEKRLQYLLLSNMFTLSSFLDMFY